MATINALNNKSAPFTVTSGDLTVTLGNAVITAGNLTLPTTSSTVGQITINSVPFLHGYGTQNVFIGGAGNFTTTGSGSNICIGKDSGLAITSGTGQQILIGVNAGKALTSTTGNIFIGYDSGSTANTGGNLFIGVETGKGATYGDPSWNDRGNIYIGNRIAKTAVDNSNSCQMVVIGYEAMEKQSQNASHNVYIGYQCAKGIYGNHGANTFVGSLAGYSMTGATYPSQSGLDRNTLIGYKAGYNYVASSQYNVILGHEILGTNGDQGIIRIGNTTNSTKAYIAGIYGVTPAGTLNIALIDSNHQLGSVASLGVANGGTGAATLTDHGLLVGSGTSAVDAMAAGTAGQIVTSSGAAADPVWTTATYPATISKGEILHASADNTITALAAGTADYVLTAHGAGNAVTWEAASGGGIGTLNGDSGSATGATVTIAGGTNITTSGASATLTVNLDAALAGLTSATFATGGSVQTGTTATNTLLIQAYDVDGTAYVPFITLTAADTPTCDLDTAVTLGTKYIYRADGTDVPVTDGGTGASTLTDHGVLLGSGTGAITATAVGATGEIFVGATGADATWLAAGTADYVLTAHGAGSAVTWEAAGAGATWLTKSDLSANANAAVNYSYTINHGTPATLLEVTLPGTAAVGDRVEIIGNTAGMWKLIAAAGDTIKLLSSTTSSGGYLLATTQYDCVEVVCTVADTTWVVCKSMGNLTVA